MPDQPAGRITRARILTAITVDKRHTAKFFGGVRASGFVRGQKITHSQIIAGQLTDGSQVLANIEGGSILTPDGRELII